MYPKTALRILIGVIIIVVVAFLIFWYYTRKTNEDMNGAGTNNEQKTTVEDVIQKKQQGAELNEMEQKTLDTFVEQKVQETQAQIKQKTEEEIKANGYTPNEADFLLDPKNATEKNLGVTEPQNKPLSQEEINKILNP